jgi:septal ring factor EnvC (AmiA/AmiB activator)
MYHLSQRALLTWAALILLVLGLFIGGIVYKHQQAEKWKDTSISQNRIAEQWKSETIKLKQQLSASENDVTSLEKRQKELANEKAQVEDDRAQLVAEQASLKQETEAISDITVELLACRTNLYSVIEDIASDRYVYNVNSMFAPCNRVDSKIRALG